MAIASMAITLAALVISPTIQATPVPTSPDPTSHAQAAAHFEELIRRGTAGFNDWDCRPTKFHPNPLVLVHGTLVNALTNWFYMAPRFVAEGYCVFALTYGQHPAIPIVYGLTAMEKSAQQLSEFVDKVLNATGADKVDMVGHSQGSLMPRYWMKNLGGASKIRKFAGIGSIQYGTNLLGLIPFLESLGLYDPIKKLVDPICESCFQFFTNSTFINDLNRDGDTLPGIDYLMIASK
ncbi:hypothetical protein BG015_002987 [Linnemannia schmuckeri]|uniref:Lipase n=1 Tax=Linnemannia schmuckeri TaxID=64567 RepID=A0A9P5RQJ9_9FUNG|nr:hypothetical protein BG015_002987 [Linnemannia schmuckeri]